MNDAPAGPPDHDAPAGSHDFVVEPCGFGDLRDIAAIQKQSFRPGLAYGYLQLMLLWLLPNTRFLVAKTRAGIVAGSVISDRFRQEVRIVNIAVDPGFRRQGVASLLLDEVQRVFPEGSITLIVEEFNEPAKALYLREGFRDVGQARNYYGRGRNGIWMRKQRPGGSPPKIYV